MYNSQVFWEHGVFLQPQHFQLGWLQNLHRTATTLSLIHPYFWGIKSVSFNEASLSSGIFEVVNMELLLPSGELVCLPSNADLAPRSFSNEWKDDAPLQVYLCLSEFKEGGANVSRADSSSADDSARYVSQSSPEVVPDLFGKGPAAEVSCMRFNLKLAFGNEESGKLWRMPLARLVKSGERVTLDETFVPPCLDIHALRPLLRIIKDVRDVLVAHSKRLEEYKISVGEMETESASSFQGITFFSILCVLSRYAPEFEQILLSPCYHPWHAFMSLCRLVGELSVFSPNLSPLGETMLGEKVLPHYDHNDIYHCMSTATAIVARLADALAIGPAFTFILIEDEASPGLFKGSMPAQACQISYDYWLLFRSSSLEKVSQDISTFGKFAPLDDMAGILGQALPGIHLRHFPQPPAGLPRRKDTLYYKINQDDPLWRKALKNGEVAFTLPGHPEDLLVQLTVLQPNL